jgi:ATP-dependent Lon protease
MVNKMVNSAYLVFDEMLIVGFGLSFKKVKELKRKRKNLPKNFMQMKIWKVLTEEQFNLLYTVLHNESLDIFIKLAILMNEEWQQTVGRYNRNKKYREFYKTEEGRKKAAAYSKKYRDKNKDKIKERDRKYYLKNKDKINKRKKNARKNKG